MRLVLLNEQGELALTKDLTTHSDPDRTWGQDEDKVPFEDI
jgi:hypothetical protein